MGVGEGGDSAEVLKRRARALAEAGDDAGAESAWRRALELGGSADLQSHHALSRLLYQSGRRIEAIAHLRAVTAAGWGGVKALRRLAQALQEDGAPEEAEAVWKRALSLEPDDADAHAALGALMMARDGAAEAVPHLRAAVDGAPDDAGAWARLARALEAAGERAAAAEALERILALEPGERTAREQLAALLEGLGRSGDAARHLRILAEANPGAVKAWRRLAWALENAGELAAALDVWRRIAELDDKIGVARERIALLQDRQVRKLESPASRSRGAQGGRFTDLRQGLALRGMDEVLIRVDRACDLGRTANALYMVDPGGEPIAHDPVIPLQADGADRIQVSGMTGEAFVVGLDNAGVIGRGVVVTESGDIVRDLLKPNSAGYGAMRLGETMVFGEAMASAGPATLFDEPAFLIAGPADLAFGDWIDNYFNRLALAQAAELDCKIVVRSDMRPQAFDILAAMGVPPGRILRHDPNGISVFPRLYASSWPILTRTTPMRGAYDVYQRAALPPPPGPGPLLYLSRQNMARRSLRNEDQVAELFASRGFRIVFPEQLSFAEARALFAGPACIAGPYGSAMRNAVFASRKPVCLAIRAPLSDGFRHWTAMWMAEAGMRMAFVDGTALPGWSVELMQGEWIAPLDAVERAIDRVLTFLQATSGD